MSRLQQEQVGGELPIVIHLSLDLGRKIRRGTAFESIAAGLEADQRGRDIASNLCDRLGQDEVLRGPSGWEVRGRPVLWKTYDDDDNFEYTIEMKVARKA